MPWKCFMSENSHEVGAMWHVSAEEWRDLSPEYKRDHEGKRLPLCVMLPARNSRGEIFGFPFCVDSKATDGDQGWTVIGDPPNITVRPSINAIGAYHGFITDGVISDGVL